MENTFSPERAKELLDAGLGQAQELVGEPSKVDELLTLLEQKLKEIPAIGSALADVPLMISLIKSYITREYTEISPKVIVSMISAFLYLIKKKDIIPDNIPIVGHVDDIAVIALAFQMCSPELEAYARWRDGGNSSSDEKAETAGNDAGAFENIPKLGFGLMRLPKLEDGVQIDIEQTKRMVDLFMEAGMRYFDTAYVYDNGLSEEAAKKALVERYPRESFYLATKLNVAAQGCVDEASAKKQLEISLERTGAGYFDFYLLHALDEDRLEKNDQYHLWDYVKEMKEKGLIRHYGFSFHDKPEVLDRLLTQHPDVEFVQLQINYADWESANVQSRACYEVARKHGKPIVVMEPVKGGTLANPPEVVQQLMKSVDAEASPASWAIRFVASQEGILTVLSGMSNLEQMEDNLSFMRDFKPLDDTENEMIKKCMQALREIKQIPCTSCHYCTPGCPMEIPIPGIFSAMNKNMIYGQLESARGEYNWRTGGKNKASDCIQCGQCESVCPQHIEIISWLEECARMLE